jgi:hypothetical protein
VLVLHTPGHNQREDQSDPRLQSALSQKVGADHSVWGLAARSERPGREYGPQIGRYSIRAYIGCKKIGQRKLTDQWFDQYSSGGPRIQWVSLLAQLVSIMDLLGPS